MKMYTIKVEYGQSVWDIAVKEHGNVEAALPVLSDNDLTPTDELISGQELHIRETPVVAKALMVSETPVAESKLYTKQAEYEQSVWDVAVQEYGNVEAVLQLLSDNDLTPNSELASGQKMNIRRLSETADRKIMDEFRRKDIRVVCSRGTLQKRGGIGFMQIGFDFIVS